MTSNRKYSSKEHGEHFFKGKSSNSLSPIKDSGLRRAFRKVWSNRMLPRDENSLQGLRGQLRSHVLADDIDRDISQRVNESKTYHSYTSSLRENPIEQKCIEAPGYCELGVAESRFRLPPAMACVSEEWTKLLSFHIITKDALEAKNATKSRKRPDALAVKIIAQSAANTKDEHWELIFTEHISPAVVIQDSAFAYPEESKGVTDTIPKLNRLFTRLDSSQPAYRNSTTIPRRGGSIRRCSEYIPNRTASGAIPLPTRGC